VSTPRKILATAALPYANGEIHIGHLVEYLQADFWTRFQRMRGHECLYICADDTHGTPVMLKARQLGVAPEDMIAEARERHIKDFGDFEIEFSNYGSTNAPENQELCESIFAAMRDNGHIDVRSISQAYCQTDQMFLPDRFVIGTCPKCGKADQAGDSCDCGATYSPLDLVDARCVTCGNQPVQRESDHIFFTLNDFRNFLQDWIKGHTQADVARKLEEWFDEDLRDWDISRDDPYFGFGIPGHPGKYFYVWVDAPIGYMASTAQWCKANGRELDEFWKADDAELYHFIGKDIVYFHTLFWPAMLSTAGYKTPDQVFVHGFLTVNGKKMAKRNGTFINARAYLNHLPPTYLRFYYACKFTATIDDVDLSFEDFASRVNSDLFGKITNLASRGASMLNRIDARIGELPPEGAAVVAAAQARSEEIAELYEARDFNKAMVIVREIADEANAYFDNAKPWTTLKTDIEATRGVLSTALNCFRVMAVYLKPILPSYVEQVEGLFGEKPYTWDDAQRTLTDHKINAYTHLLTKLDPKQIEAIVNETKDAAAAAEAQKAAASLGLAAEIGIDDFCKVDLRIAKIVAADDVPEASKLLKLTIDLGPGGQRTIFAGIKAAYKPEDLVGRLTIVVANLAPRKMRFGTSEGMILAAGEGGSDLFILSPDSGAKPGQRVQ
jgi:methionyl-tRNA synthetase